MQTRALIGDAQPQLNRTGQEGDDAHRDVGQQPPAARPVAVLVELLLVQREVGEGGLNNEDDSGEKHHCQNYQRRSMRARRRLDSNLRIRGEGHGCAFCHTVVVSHP